MFEYTIFSLSTFKVFRKSKISGLPYFFSNLLTKWWRTYFPPWVKHSQYSIELSRKSYQEHIYCKWIKWFIYIQKSIPHTYVPVGHLLPRKYRKNKTICGKLWVICDPRSTDNIVHSFVKSCIAYDIGNKSNKMCSIKSWQFFTQHVRVRKRCKTTK